MGFDHVSKVKHFMFDYEKLIQLDNLKRLELGFGVSHDIEQYYTDVLLFQGKFVFGTANDKDIDVLISYCEIESEVSLPKKFTSEDIADYLSEIVLKNQAVMFMNLVNHFLLINREHPETLRLGKIMKEVKEKVKEFWEAK